MAKNKLGPLLENDGKDWNRERQKLPRKVGDLMVREFKANFRSQGFKDASVTRWKPRKGESRRTRRTKALAPEGRNILVKSGRLSNSLRKIRTNKNSVVVGSTIKYSGVHNYGLRSGRGRGRGFTMPQRKFVGHSREVNRKVINLLNTTVKRAFRG